MPRRRTRRLATQKPRLTDVAKHAQVSEATASRAINRPNLVSPDLRERVAHAVEELGYVAHGAARALASDRTRSIGAVVPTLDLAIFAIGIGALQRALNPYGFNLIVASSDYDHAKEHQEVRALIQHGVDGLVLVGEQHLPETYKLLEKSALPYVNTYQYTAGTQHPCIGIDNQVESYRVANYLIELGHRTIVVVTSPTRSNDRIAGRVHGAMQCCRDQGLPEPHVIEVPYSLPDGRRALHSALTKDPQTTAVLCTNDMLAIGLLLEAHTIGLSIPHDLSVTGFDDLDLAQHMDPPLTTVRVPIAELGQRVADYLMTRLGGDSTHVTTALSASFIVRGSTGRPPKRGRREVQRIRAAVQGSGKPTAPATARSATSPSE